MGIAETKKGKGVVVLMPGTVRNLAAAGTFAGLDVSALNKLPASFMNSYRVAAVIDQLALLVMSGKLNNSQEFFSLCLSLARGIDYAVANNEVPAKAQEIPLLLRQICQHKNDLLLQAAIMVLMISVKNACKIGWFPDVEVQELFKFANEIERSFCSPGDYNIGPSHSLTSISKIMARFYPRMKLGLILSSLEVKPGYGTYMIDFNISKKTDHLPEEKIRLFVTRIDDMETSACLISPQHANFLLNGRGVEKRTNVLMDPGPQMPTNVTPLLKYGTNLLQAVGQFNGHYVIVIAFMSVTPMFDIPVIQDYIPPPVAALNSDDIIEGPSRISLNCPISYKRIKTPVKGHSCKHLQCFDFSNYVVINSRRPSWRCPHCNQYLSYTDIRVDQNVLKVLTEVGENVDDVIISAEGSWKAVVETDDNVDPTRGQPLVSVVGGSEKKESTSTSSAHPIVLDLTGVGEDPNEMDICETEEKKPVRDDLQNQSVVINQSLMSDPNSANWTNHNVVSHLDDDFWSGLYSSGELPVSSYTSDSQNYGTIYQSAPPNYMTSPVLTDAISPAPNLEAEGHGDTNSTSSVMHCQLPNTNNLTVQQPQLVNPLPPNEYGRLTSIPVNITRTPMVIQALPARSRTPSLQQRPGISVNGTSHTPVSMNNVYREMERPHQFSVPHSNPFHPSDISSMVRRLSPTQNLANQDSSFTQGQSVQQVVGLTVPPSQPWSAYGMSSPDTILQNAHLQQAWNTRFSQYMSQSQQGVSQVGRTAGIGNSQQDNTMQQDRHRDIASHAARQAPSVPVQIQTARTRPSPSVAGDARTRPSPSIAPDARTRPLPSVASDAYRAQVGEQRATMRAVPRSDDFMDIASDQNWRPTGRMRGSLSGRAYSDALSHYMSPPIQLAAAQSPSTLPSPSSIPPQLQALFANNRIPHSSQTRNHPQTTPASTNGALGVLPHSR